MAWHDSRRLAESFTYLIQGEDGGPVKIGVAQDPHRRATELQTGNPQKLVVVAFYKHGRFERELHERFAHLRLRGEWFHESVLDELFPVPELPELPDVLRCTECSAMITPNRNEGQDGWCVSCAAWADSLAAATA